MLSVDSVPEVRALGTKEVLPIRVVNKTATPGSRSRSRGLSAIERVFNLRESTRRKFAADADT
jgi:hypothetical protein